ncbi:MAG: hypothetical protein M1819_001126 [Sarea resinae]|nr:MAG: hypothetical protein M1819_001126 [Sarea resinae]
MKTYSIASAPDAHHKMIANTVLVVVATIILCLRLVSRRIKQAGLWWDDFAIFVVLILTFTLYAIQIADSRYGMGHHVENVPPENIVVLLKMLVAFQVVYGFTMLCAKWSILLFYLRVFPHHGFRKMVIFCMIITGSWAIANVLQVFLICRPFRYNWDVTIKGTCGNRNADYAAIGALNIATDVMVLTLPLRPVWKLQTANTVKVGLSGIFAIGLLITIISIVRMQSLLVLNFADFSYSMINPVFWTVTEPSLAIISACLPMLRPVLNYVFPKNFWGKSSRDQRSTGNPISKSFERLEEGNYPLTRVDLGVTTTDIAANTSESNLKGPTGTARSLDDETDSVRRVSQDLGGGINVKQEWKVQSH